MWSFIKSIFKKKPKQPTLVQLLCHIEANCRLVSEMQNPHLFEVNQKLTGLLLEDEETFSEEGSGYGMSEDEKKRHFYLSKQLKELRELRQQIYDIYLWLNENN